MYMNKIDLIKQPVEKELEEFRGLFEDSLTSTDPLLGEVLGLGIVRQRKARSRGEHVQEHHESPADGFPDARQPAGIRAEKA